MNFFTKIGRRISRFFSKKEGYSLFLDDERNPKTKRNWTTARHYQQFIDIILLKGMPDYISFDHDLGEEKTGMDCACWLVNYCLDHKLSLPEWNVHSANTPGRENIDGLMKSFRKFQKENK